MNTFGTFRSWHFENWIEVFEEYEDGFFFEKWYAINPWIDAIPATPLEIYAAFSEQDWRRGSCGGCI